MQEIELDCVLRIFDLIQKLHSERSQTLMDILDLIHPWGRFDHGLVNEAPYPLRFYRLPKKRHRHPIDTSMLPSLPALPVRYYEVVGRSLSVGRHWH